uniref:Nucleoside diphosphate kinase-like domain-containing protein n=1 Tax=Strombidium rassoulzadegani TaxID=1082188 RepID=A0A7S3CTM4_9SPIT|mmetsp:Transcript_8364/g.13984  ORF Transcript_8364/g.13984 Transcript_8364/m.13984 type:complete len:260 (+) Transcript_8364:393-1172(+)
MARLTQEDVVTLFPDQVQQTAFVSDFITHLTSDVCLGLELLKVNAVEDLLRVAGPSNALQAKNQAPDSLRAMFGKESLRNAVHASESEELASSEIDYFFNQGKHKAQGHCKTSAILNNCSLLMLKPNILKTGAVGGVINALLNEGGFEISAAELFNLSKQSACEFFEVYKGVDPDFNSATDYVAFGGPVVVLEVRQEDVVQKLRHFCGPHDPEEARRLRPGSLRALHGSDRIQNGVHCTDLEEDGSLECEFFFVLMQSN